LGVPGIRVLLADDHAMVREALRRVLESGGEIDVVAEASDGLEAVALSVQHAPDVAVLDLWMPLLSGQEATRRIIESGCGTRVLILSMHESATHVHAALGAGASGYVAKSAASRELIEALHAVCSGRGYVSPAVARHVVDTLQGRRSTANAIDALTTREREVLCMLADGLSTKEVAAHLGVSIKTADTHRASLMKKLDIHKVSALVRLAVREGLVAP
jgi:DNA-binding NarL/FixJ family response regulator